MPFPAELRAIFEKHGIYPEVIALNIQPGDQATINGETVTVVDVRPAVASIQENTDWTHSLTVRGATGRMGVVTYRPDNGEVGNIGWLPERDVWGNPL